MAWGYRMGRLGAGVGIVGILGCSRIENEDVINLKKRILLEVGTLKNPVKFDIFPRKTFSLKAEEDVTEAPKESVSDTVEEIEVAKPVVEAPPAETIEVPEAAPAETIEVPEAAPAETIEVVDIPPTPEPAAPSDSIQSASEEVVSTEAPPTPEGPPATPPEDPAPPVDLTPLSDPPTPAPVVTTSGPGFNWQIAAVTISSILLFLMFTKSSS